jgi:hypothetical protein
MGIATMTQISVRLSQREKEHLQKYCELSERNQTEVLRDLVRRLSIKGALNPLDWHSTPSLPHGGWGISRNPLKKYNKSSATELHLGRTCTKTFAIASWGDRYLKSARKDG